MFLATAIVSVLLAALLVFAAVRKLSHRQEVVRTYVRVGVPEDRLNQLAILLIAGAAGLLAGLAWAPLGLAAAAGLVLYFIGAIVFHLRAGDIANIATPIVLEALALAALALRLTAT